VCGTCVRACACVAAARNRGVSWCAYGVRAVRARTYVSNAHHTFERLSSLLLSNEGACRAWRSDHGSISSSDSQYLVHNSTRAKIASYGGQRITSFLQRVFFYKKDSLKEGGYTCVDRTLT